MLTRDEAIKLIDDGHCDDSDGTYFCADCKYKLMSVINHFLEDNQKPDGIRLNYIDILSGHLTAQSDEMIKMERGVLNKVIALLKQQPEQPRREIKHLAVRPECGYGDGLNLGVYIATADNRVMGAVIKDKGSPITWLKLPPIPQDDKTC